MWKWRIPRRPRDPTRTAFMAAFYTRTCQPGLHTWTVDQPPAGTPCQCGAIVAQALHDTPRQTY